MILERKGRLEEKGIYRKIVRQGLWDNEKQKKRLWQIWKGLKCYLEDCLKELCSTTSGNVMSIIEDSNNIYIMNIWSQKKNSLLTFKGTLCIFFWYACIAINLSSTLRALLSKSYILLISGLTVAQF